MDKCKDNDGNFLALLIEYEGRQILVEGIYGPNTDQPLFYEETVFEKIDSWGAEFSVIVGDWNLTLDPQKDTKNYLHDDNNIEARRVVQSKLNQYNLNDVWRTLNPDTEMFTWRKPGRDLKFARLDFFVISNSLLPYVESVKIEPGCFSDHSPVILDLDFSRFKKGRGFWKFNNSLLYDPVYVALIKNLIKKVVTQYATIDENPNFYNTATAAELEQWFSEVTPEILQELDININPQLFFDTLLMEIRGETLQYTARIKRGRMERQQILSHEIEVLEGEIHNFPNGGEYLEKLQQKREELEEIYSNEARGAYVRAKSKYKVDGERPTKLFCALEKHNGIQRYIPRLKVIKDNVEVTIEDQKKIEDETVGFYKTLYSNNDDKITIDSIESFLGDNISNNCPKLSESQKNGMEGLIDIGELTKYLKKCRNNVSPGSTGFTGDFYKFFWRDLKYFATKSINYGYETNSLSVSQRLGILTLIPKGDKSKLYLKNWRPLTLLNTLYKLTSGCIAERIKPCLDSIIHPDQKGFVAGRYIGECIRSTFDILDYAKSYNKAGVLLLILKKHMIQFHLATLKNA